MGEVEQYDSRSSLSSVASWWAVDAGRKSSHGLAELSENEWSVRMGETLESELTL